MIRTSTQVRDVGVGDGELGCECSVSEFLVESELAPGVREWLRGLSLCLTVADEVNAGAVARQTSWQRS